MTAATEFRQIRLSRETRNWLAVGAEMLKRVARESEEDTIDSERIRDLAFACETVVDEYDAAGGGEAA